MYFFAYTKEKNSEKEQRKNGKDVQAALLSYNSDFCQNSSKGWIPGTSWFSWKALNTVSPKQTAKNKIGL